MAQVPSIKAIIFDWGDSLVRVPGLTTDESGHVACVQAFFEEDLPHRLGAGHQPTNWSEFRRCYLDVAGEQVKESRRTGREHSFHDRLGITLQRAGLTTPFAESELKKMADLLANRLAACCTPIEGAAEALSALAQRYPLSLLSNYPHPEVVVRTLFQFGLQPFLDPVVVSGEIGWAKPHASAFEACLTRIGERPEDVLFVGDDPETDMRGAHEAGFRTCWIMRETGSPPQHHVDIQTRSVSELAEMLV